jgi:hypothetical protein
MGHRRAWREDRGIRSTSRPAPRIRLPFKIVEKPKPSHTCNVRLSKLTLGKAGGVCSKAIDEAF